MSTGRQNTGFPSNNIKGNDWSYNPGCGGMGAGSCFLPAAFSYLYWEIRVNPFSRHNSKLVIYNDGFKAFTDSPVGLCEHNAGASVSFDVLLFHRKPVGVLDRSKATGVITVPTNVFIPYELEFDALDIPQPSDPEYERRVWVVVDLKQAGLMIGGIPQESEVMKTLKINWEGQP